jgi:hypothetical protein
MRLIELLSRVCDVLPGPHSETQRRAIAIVLRKWPSVRRFTNEQLIELYEELR